LAGSPTGEVDAKMNIPLTGQNLVSIEFSGMLFKGGLTGQVFPLYFRNDVTTQSSARQAILYKGNGTTARWQLSEFANSDIIKATYTYKIT
jgi:hypothetical protein